MNPDHRIEERLQYAKEQARLLQLQMQAEAEIRHRDRRERIATAALQGLTSNPNFHTKLDVARWSIDLADALIAELDKEVKP